MTRHNVLGAGVLGAAMAAAMSGYPHDCRKCAHTYKPKPKVVKECNTCVRAINDRPDRHDSCCWQCVHRQEVWGQHIDSEDNWVEL